MNNDNNNDNTPKKQQQQQQQQQPPPEELQIKRNTTMDTTITTNNTTKNLVAGEEEEKQEEEHNNNKNNNNSDMTPPPPPPPPVSATSQLTTTTNIDVTSNLPLEDQFSQKLAQSLAQVEENYIPDSPSRTRPGRTIETDGEMEDQPPSSSRRGQRGRQSSPPPLPPTPTNTPAIHCPTTTTTPRSSLVADVSITKTTDMNNHKNNNNTKALDPPTESSSSKSRENTSPQEQEQPQLMEVTPPPPPPPDDDDDDDDDVDVDRPLDSPNRIHDNHKKEIHALQRIGSMTDESEEGSSHHDGHNRTSAEPSGGISIQLLDLSQPQRTNSLVLDESSEELSNMAIPSSSGNYHHHHLPYHGSVSNWGDSTATLQVTNVRPSLKLRVQQQQQEDTQKQEEEEARQRRQMEQQQLRQRRSETLRKINEKDSNLSSSSPHNRKKDDSEDVSLNDLFSAAHHHQVQKTVGKKNDGGGGNEVAVDYHEVSNKPKGTDLSQPKEYQPFLPPSCLLHQDPSPHNEPEFILDKPPPSSPPLPKHLPQDVVSSQEDVEEQEFVVVAMDRAPPPATTTTPKKPPIIPTVPQSISQMSSQDKYEDEDEDDYIDHDRISTGQKLARISVCVFVLFVVILSTILAVRREDGHMTTTAPSLRTPSPTTPPTMAPINSGGGDEITPSPAIMDDDPPPTPMTTNFVLNDQFFGSVNNAEFGTSVALNREGTVMAAIGIGFDTDNEPIRVYAAQGTDTVNDGSTSTPIRSWSALSPIPLEQSIQDGSINLKATYSEDESVAIASSSIGLVTLAVASHTSIRVLEYNSIDKEWLPKGMDVSGLRWVSNNTTATNTNNNNEVVSTPTLTILPRVSTPAVALSGDASVLAVGSLNENAQAIVVRVFSYDSTSEEWILKGKPLIQQRSPPASTTTIILAFSLALSGDGDHLVISDFVFTQPGTSTQAYQWSTTQDRWDTMGPALEYTLGPTGLALSDDGQRMGVAISSLGVSRVYQWDISNRVWEQLGSDLLGSSSIALTHGGSRILIGQPQAGQAWTLDYNGEDWMPNNPLTTPGISTWFGADVSMSSDGNVLVVGAPFDNVSGENSGSVFIYS